jgi:hypothetical protein
MAITMKIADDDHFSVTVVGEGSGGRAGAHVFDNELQQEEVRLTVDAGGCDDENGAAVGLAAFEGQAGVGELRKASTTLAGSISASEPIHSPICWVLPSMNPVTMGRLGELEKTWSVERAWVGQTCHFGELVEDVPCSRNRLHRGLSSGLEEQRTDRVSNRANRPRFLGVMRSAYFRPRFVGRGPAWARTPLTGAAIDSAKKKT